MTKIGDGKDSNEIVYQRWIGVFQNPPVARNDIHEKV